MMTISEFCSKEVTILSQEKKPEAPKLSKKKLRRMNRFTVAELKQVRPKMIQQALDPS